MAQLVADLTGEIRSAQAPARSPGYAAPSTSDRAQSPATTTPVGTGGAGRQADFPVEGVGGPARRDQANHYGWKLQAGMEIKSYAETVAIRDAAADAIVVLDPSVATIWRINAAGNLALQVADIPDGTVGGMPVSRSISLVLYIQRAEGAALTWPAGTLWGSDVIDPDGDGDPADSLLGPAAAARMDVFVLNRVPTIGWVGFPAALGLVAV